MTGSFMVPETADAMHRLVEYAESVDGHVLEFELSKDEYDALWGSGVLERLNDELHKWIDMYEDEAIVELVELERGTTIVAEACSSADAPIVLSKLLEAFEAACRFQTCIVFYF